MRIVDTLLVLSALGSVGCGGGDVPAEERLARARDNLMVGPNTLVDLYRAPFVAPTVRSREVFLGRSTAALIDSGLIVNGALGHYQLDLCDGEEFDNTVALKKSSIGGCSSALVGDTLLLTARHCLSDTSGNPTPLGNLRAVFGYDVQAPVYNTQADTTVSPDDVYTPVAVIAQGTELGDAGDWALIALDRPVSPHYRRLQIQGDPQVNMSVSAFGYPLAMAVKYSTPGDVWQWSGGQWRAAISAQAGSSGSPVLDAASQQIVGVLTSGPQDLVYDSAAHCNRWYVCPECGVGGPGAAAVAAYVSPPVPSCAGACNGQSPDGCWCDAACRDYGDCCGDVRICDAYQNPGPSSCAGACGSSAGNCWCDLECPQFGDCCSDFFQTCGRADGW